MAFDVQASLPSHLSHDHTGGVGGEEVSSGVLGTALPGFRSRNPIMAKAE